MRCNMGKNEKIYIDLQRHIDSQVIGFPATKRGSELRILKHIFSPKEAEISTCLTYKLEPVETVFPLQIGHLLQKQFQRRFQRRSRIGSVRAEAASPGEPLIVQPCEPFPSPVGKRVASRAQIDRRFACLGRYRTAGTSKVGDDGGWRAPLAHSRRWPAEAEIRPVHLRRIRT